LCNPPTGCLATATKRRAFERAFRRPVDSASVLALQQEFQHTGASGRAGDRDGTLGEEREG
jgi:hypothetical protein